MHTPTKNYCASSTTQWTATLCLRPIQKLIHPFVPISAMEVRSRGEKSYRSGARLRSQPPALRWRLFRHLLSRCRPMAARISARRPTRLVTLPTRRFPSPPESQTRPSLSTRTWPPFPISGRILRSRRNPSGTARTLTITNLRGTLRADPRDMAARPATPNRRRRKATRTAALHGAAKSTQTAGSRDLFAHPLEENLGAGSIRSSV